MVKVLPTPKTEAETTQEAKEREQRAANEQEIVKFNQRLIIIGILQLVVFVSQLFVFGYQALKLHETVTAAAEQSSQMKKSVAESARAASAMEDVAKAVAATAKASAESVATVKERTAMQMRAYLVVIVGTAVYQERDKNLVIAHGPDQCRLERDRCGVLRGC